MPPHDALHIPTLPPGKYENRHKKNPRRKGHVPKGSLIEAVNLGANYTADEEEWLKAIMAFQAKHRRYPTTQEAFAIALSLGYRKTTEGV